MKWEIRMLLVLMAGVSGSPRQDSTEHFHFNSTFLPEKSKLFKPIVIPNITDYFQLPRTTESAGTVRQEEPSTQQALQPSQPPRLTDSEEKSTVNGSKFSSRYSRKEKDGGRTGEVEESLEERSVGVVVVADSSERSLKEGGNEGAEKQKSFSDRSYDLDSSEEEKEEEDVEKYFDGNEPEESEVSRTTNEPYEDLARPTSFRNEPYLDEHLKNDETTVTEEKNSSEEEETEEKRSLSDYHNADSKNYHSVQTPLSKIKYRGPHSFQENFDSDRVRTRLVSPIRRHPIGHNWPYSRSQINAELDKENEISESDESSLEEGIREELKRKPSALGLELAVQRDEIKFDRNRNYDYLEERNRGKQKLKSLLAEEEKDHRRSPFQVLKQYQVNEEPRYQPPKKTPPGFSEGIWSTRSPPITTSKNRINGPHARPSKLDITDELASSFQGHQFLGPVVFNPDVGQDKAKPQLQKGPLRKESLTALLEKEKVDQDNLSNQRSHKSIFGTGAVTSSSQSFNHLEESEEMYNAILANIQSVFGLRTQPGGRSSGVGVEESKSLTWSLPLIKRSKVD